MKSNGTSNIKQILTLYVNTVQSPKFAQCNVVHISFKISISVLHQLIAMLIDLALGAVNNETFYFVQLINFE